MLNKSVSGESEKPDKLPNVIRSAQVTKVLGTVVYDEDAADEDEGFGFDDNFDEDNDGETGSFGSDDEEEYEGKKYGDLYIDNNNIAEEGVIVSGSSMFGDYDGDE